MQDTVVTASVFGTPLAPLTSSPSAGKHCASDMMLTAMHVMMTNLLPSIIKHGGSGYGTGG